jgi:hypothetical protein
MAHEALTGIGQSPDFNRKSSVSPEYIAQEVVGERSFLSC